MPARIRKLLSLVKRVCAAERGRKASLARACSVRASQVSEWLGERQEPGAEAVLHILSWLKETDPTSYRKLKL